MTRTVRRKYLDLRGEKQRNKKFRKENKRKMG